MRCQIRGDARNDAQALAKVRNQLAVRRWRSGAPGGVHGDEQQLLRLVPEIEPAHVGVDR